jgi:hypothetical protein
MGVSRMAAACSELQEVGASGDLARARELLEWTEAEFERVRPMLEAETAGSQKQESLTEGLIAVGPRLRILRGERGVARRAGFMVQATYPT